MYSCKRNNRKFLWFLNAAGTLKHVCSLKLRAFTPCFCFIPNSSVSSPQQSPVDMKNSTRVWLVGAFLTLAVVSSALPQSLFRASFPRVESVNVQDDALSTSEDVVVTRMFTQKVDHFRPQDKATYQQRYFARSDYWKQLGQPPLAYICVGGEGPPLAASALIDSVHCTEMVVLAKQTGAMLFAIEHRYYGKSVVTKDLSTANLAYLSAKQAAEDIKYFIQGMYREWGLKLDTKWVTFGGSYPGMLASFARIKYPHIIHAAVASSAPTYATTEMPGYNRVVGEALRATSVGGSEACREIVRLGHEQVGKYLTYEQGREKLAADFMICGGASMLTDKGSVAEWAGMGVLDVPAQSNDPSCTQKFCDIGSICRYLTKNASTTPYERIVYVAKEQFYSGAFDLIAPEAVGSSHRYHDRRFFADRRRGLRGRGHGRNEQGNECRDIDWESYMDYLATTDVSNGGRVWMYQTCAEFGFYQTCTKEGDCPFTHGVNEIPHHLDMCARLFNISESQIDANVLDSNLEWGGLTPRTPRIMYINGEVDPWRANSIQTQLSELQPLIEVKGASHHFWTHVPKASDSAAVNATREAIYSWVKKMTSLAP